MKAIILNNYGPGKNYADLVYQGIKTAETRTGRSFKYRGDIVICCGQSNSVGPHAGLALCVVNIFAGRPMIESDEEAACIEWRHDRHVLLLKDWRYFSSMFKFSTCKTGGDFRGLFDIEIPSGITLIPQPQIHGFQEWPAANEVKGALNGLCNRSACLAPGAHWYNHSTRAYYCSNCASMINDYNRTDAMRLFGHELCTFGKPNTDQEAAAT